MEALSEGIINEVDIGALIVETINSLCQSLFSSIDNAVFPILDDLIFVSPEIVKTNYLERILGTNTNMGLLVLANSLILAFILFYAVRRFIAFYAGNEVESPYVFIIKGIFVTILMNFSLSLCSMAVSFTYEITNFITSLGTNIFNTEISFSSLINMLSSSFSSEFNVFSLDGILTGMLSVSSFSLIISFALRYILIKVLILTSPFAFLCLLNKTTTGFFRSWYRSLLSLLLVQILIALIILLPYALIKDSSSQIINKLLIVGAINALLKSGQYVKEFMGGIGISTNFQNRSFRIKIYVDEVTMIKYIFPLNYKYSDKLLGIIEYKTLIPLCVYGAILLLILSNIHIDFLFSCSIFIVLFFPPLFLSINTINGETIFSFIFAIIKFKKNSKVYLYEKDCKNTKKKISFVHGGKEHDF